MFNVAVPDIAADFNLAPSMVSLVMSGYIMVFAMGALIYGSMADIYPVRILITVGVVVLNAGSIAGFFSDWYPMLVASRMLQAAGGASIPALAMLTATRYLPREIRGRVLGYIASTVAAAMGVGPVLGGIVAGGLHWRYLFLITLPTLLALMFLRRMLRGVEAEDKSDGFDVLGAALVAMGVALLLFSVTMAAMWAAPVGLILMAAFLLHAKGHKRPFISLGLLTDRRYAGTLVTALLCSGSVFGMLFMTPILLRDINGLDSKAIGLVLFPGAMAGAVLGTLGGRLTDKIGGVRVAYIGMFLLVLGYMMLSTVSGGQAIGVMLVLLVAYTGFTFMQASMAHTVSGALSPGNSGIGMGVYNLCYFMSGAFSSAIVGRLLDLKTSSFSLNPFNDYDAGWLYANVFLLLAAVVFIAAAIFSLSVAAKDKAD